MKQQVSWTEFVDQAAALEIVMHALYRFCSMFPRFLRDWIDRNGNRLSVLANKLIETHISSALFELEANNIINKQHEWSDEDFCIYIFKNSRQIQGVFCKEDIKIEVMLTMPISYPRQTIQINFDGIRQVDAKNNEIRKLAMRTMMSKQNATILQALMFWKKNIEMRFDGIDECAICYFVIHEKTKKIPNMACRNCKKKFHGPCIQKWFDTSGKTECPLCKCQFF